MMTRAAALAALVPATLAWGQLEVTIDPSDRKQMIEGFGVAAAGAYHAPIHALFEQPSFAALLRDDLGVTIVRVGVPSELQPVEDLDPDTLNWSTFDFESFDLIGNFAAYLNDGHPGAVKVIATIWSPPAWMKTNGSVIGGRLRLDRYRHFAKFCAGACLGFENHYGVPIYALSPQNEPVFTEPYASCVYSTTEYRNAVAAVAAAFDTWNVQSQVFGPEDVGTDPARWLTFPAALATSPVALQRMDALAIHHFPWENNTYWTSPTAWAALRQNCVPFGKPIWVTEISGEEPTWFGTPENAKGALTLAVQIHDALVYGGVTAYVYWAVSDPTATIYALMAVDQPTKKYYACKQFFRYIRPGAQRVAASVGNQQTMVSAYVHDADRTMTVVMLNTGANPSPVRLTISGGTAPQTFATVRSSETENAAVLPATPVVNGRVDLTLPPYSVVTLYGTNCYPNCDGSTAPPVLNVGDFVCFQQRFAAGDPYANCDGSTTPPVLNVGDFVCFQQQFAAGCP